MTLEEIRLYCLGKKLVTEDLPFDENTLAFRVAERIFLLTSLSAVDLKINLKCDPDKAILLREEYFEIQPGFHMNKRHWNTVDCTGELSRVMLKELIDHSYELIVAKLPAKARRELGLQP